MESKETHMHPGKTVRLQKLWKHKRNVLIPFDHANYSGPVPGIEDTLRLTERIAGTEADGILITPGVLKHVAQAVGDLGIILRIDGGFTKYSTEQRDYEELCSIEDAIRLGADAAIIFTFLNTDAEAVSARRLGKTAMEADRWGFPLVSEILPRALLNNHFGTNVFALKEGTTPDVFEETRTAVRIGAEAGADVIKTRYTGNIDQFREIVRSAGARVIVAGGPLLGEGDEALLRLAADCVKADADGIIFGRNVWQHPKMEKLIAALCAIVHDDESVRNALKLLK
jgi:fructose-bisphosphate aldolase / 2-amino-3,7-dideoxy-D-threo-hept-6-ulosonate synthase